MAEVNGKLISCDRCGKIAFLKCTGEGETDGGFTRWNNFEPDPPGWGYLREVGRLCSDCNSEYNRLLENFKSKGEEGANDAT